MFFAICIAISLILNTFVTLTASALIGFASILLYLRFTCEKNCSHVTIIFKIKWMRLWFSFVLFAIILPLILFSASQHTSGALFQSWDSINIIDLLELPFMILLISFFPGYLILKIIDKNNRLGLLELFVLAFCISSFISPFLIYVVLYLFTGFGYYARLTLLFIYAFMIPFILLKKTSKYSNFKVNRHQIYDLFIIVCLLGLYLLGTYVFSKDYGLMLGFDTWRFHGLTLNIINRGHVLLNYPYWFELQLVPLFGLSSFPTINTSVILNCLNFLTVPAFYLVVKSFFPKANSNVPILSTFIWTLFQGFAWISYVEATYNNINSMDVFRILSTIGSQSGNDSIFSNLWVWGYAPSTVALVSIFVLTYLFLKKDLPDGVRFVVGFFAFIGGYMTYIPVVFTFLIVFCSVSIFFYNRINYRRLKIIFIAILLGHLFVNILDVLSPMKGYGIQSSNLLIFILIISTLIAISIRRRFSLNTTYLVKLGWFLKKIWTPFLAIFVFLYIVSFSAWLLLKYEIPLQTLTVVPWYLYPLRLGLVGTIILIAAILKIEDKKNYIIKILLVSSTLLFFFGKSISYINTIFQTGYYEIRILRVFLPITLSIIAAYYVSTIFSKLKKQRIVLASILVLLVILGTPSTILSIQYINDYPRSTEITETMNSFDKLGMIQISPEERVGTFDESSFQGLLAFSGQRTVLNPWRRLLFDSTTFESFTFASSQSNLKLLYISPKDKEIFSQWRGESFFNQHLYENLYPIYDENNISIYEIPYFTPPTVDSPITVVVPDYPNFGNQYILDSISTAGLPYVTTHDFTYHPEGNSYLIVTDDPINDQILLANRLEWVKNGGQLILMNSGPLGDIALSQLSLLPEQYLNFSDLRYWDISYGDGKLSLNDNFSDSNFVVDLNLETDDSGVLRVGYQPLTPFDFSNVSNLRFSLHVSDFEKQDYQLIFRDNAGGYRRYLFKPNPGSWDLVNIQLDSPVDSSTIDVNLSELRSIEIGLNARPNESFNFSICNMSILISVLGETTSISRGTVYLSFPKPASFQKVTLNADSIALALYNTEESLSFPAIVQKKYGNGTIIYAYLEPIVDLLGTLEVSSDRANLFSKLHVLIEMIGLDITDFQTENEQNVPYSISSQIRIKGQVRIYTDYARLDNDVIHDGKSLIIELVTNGTVFIDPLRWFGSLTKISAEFPFSLNILSNNSVYEQIDVAEECVLIAQKPRFELSGEIVFEDLYLYGNPTSKDLDITGDTLFEILISDGYLIIYNLDLQNNDQLTIFDSLKKILISEVALPWDLIIISPLGLIAIIFGIVVWIGRRKYFEDSFN